METQPALKHQPSAEHIRSNELKTCYHQLQFILLTMKAFTFASLVALAASAAIPEAGQGAAEEIEARQLNTGWNPLLPYPGAAPVCSSGMATALCCQLDAIGLADLTCVPRELFRVPVHTIRLTTSPLSDRHVQRRRIQGFLQQPWPLPCLLYPIHRMKLSLEPLPSPPLPSPSTIGN